MAKLRGVDDDQLTLVCGCQPPFSKRKPRLSRVQHTIIQQCPAIGNSEHRSALYYLRRQRPRPTQPCGGLKASIQRRPGEFDQRRRADKIFGGQCMTNRIRT